MYIKILSLRWVLFVVLPGLFKIQQNAVKNHFISIQFDSLPVSVSAAPRLLFIAVQNFIFNELKTKKVSELWNGYSIGETFLAAVKLSPRVERWFLLSIECIKCH